MFFQKNLPMWERALRVCIGLVIGVGGFALLGDPTAKWAAVAVGVVSACTGFIGVCPMCALVGRKLKQAC